MHYARQVADFTEIVKRAQERGSDTVLRMACGLQDLMRDDEGGGKETLERIQEFLDDFYQVREISNERVSFFVRARCENYEKSLGQKSRKKRNSPCPKSACPLLCSLTMNEHG